MDILVETRAAVPSPGGDDGSGRQGFNGTGPSVPLGGEGEARGVDAVPARPNYLAIFPESLQHHRPRPGAG